MVQDVVEVFIDDPLPAFYEKNPGDTTGFDILYAGKRVDTEVRTVEGEYGWAFKWNAGFYSLIRVVCIKVYFLEVS